MRLRFMARCVEQETDFGVVTYWTFNGGWYDSRVVLDAAIDALRIKATRLAVEIEIVEVSRRVAYPKHW